MREITIHRPGLATSTLDEVIRIETADDPAADGAEHKYQLFIKVHGEWAKSTRIDFQKGPYQPIPNDQVPYQPNGISTEALLAVCIDHIRQYQSGKFPCRENALAITKMEEALHWLQFRTRDRLSRGIEGQAKP